MGAQEAGAVAALMTIMLMDRQEREVSMFGKGFLAGVTVQCHTFGAPPNFSSKTELPLKVASAVSNWVLTRDQYAVSTWHSLGVLQCVALGNKQQKQQLSEVLKTCVSSFTPSKSFKPVSPP